VLKDATLDVSLKSLTSATEYTADLAMLRPEPIRHIVRPAGYLCAALAAAAVAAFFFALSLDRSAAGMRAAALLLSALLMAGCVGFVAAFAARSRHVLAFPPTHGIGRAVVLRWRKPTPEAFDAFVRELNARIEQSRARMAKNAAQAELQGLSRLKDEGRLSEEEFHAGEARILASGRPAGEGHERAAGSAPQKLKLSYRAGLFCREDYTLRERSLDVLSQGLWKASQYRLDLGALVPSYATYRNVSKSWLIGTALFGPGSIVFLLLALSAPGRVSSLLEWFAFGGTVALFIASVVKLTASALRLVIFLSASDGRPLVVLRWGKPDKASFEPFVKELQARIVRRHGQRRHAGLDAKLAELERLRRERRISSEDLRTAKAELLDLEPWQLE
jgi:hypothetical protein